VVAAAKLEFLSLEVSALMPGVLGVLAQLRNLKDLRLYTQVCKVDLATLMLLGTGCPALSQLSLPEIDLAAGAETLGVAVFPQLRELRLLSQGGHLNGRDLVSPLVQACPMLSTLWILQALYVQVTLEDVASWRAASPALAVVVISDETMHSQTNKHLLCATPSAKLERSVYCLERTSMNLLSGEFLRCAFEVKDISVWVRLFRDVLRPAQLCDGGDSDGRTDDSHCASEASSPSSLDMYEMSDWGFSD